MNRVKGEKRPGVLPSPNWYLPAIASVNEEGQLAFGARNEVYIVDVRTQWLEKRMGGQEGRISSVCFLHGPLPLLAASSDRTLCLWNYEKGSVHARHKEHKVRGRKGEKGERRKEWTMPICLPILTLFYVL